ncbi:MAG TPA: hypothetical protein VMU98_01025 [Acidimicrobiales bacterium]|nr:hypothetical protein [Acidimicrobiales bacterium]
MIIYLISIPLAVLGFAAAIVPLVMGMKYQEREDLQRGVVVLDPAGAAIIESRKFELAA